METGRIFSWGCINNTLEQSVAYGSLISKIVLKSCLRVLVHTAVVPHTNSFSWCPGLIGILKLHVLMIFFQEEPLCYFYDLKCQNELPALISVHFCIFCSDVEMMALSTVSTLELDGSVYPCVCVRCWTHVPTVWCFSEVKTHRLYTNAKQTSRLLT